MKRLALIILFLLLLAGLSYANDYEVNKKAGGYDVKVSIDRNPPIVGDNNVTIGIKDATGKYVTDAKVIVYYFMQSMPSMNYTADARLEGSMYNAIVKPTMVGDWDLDVKFTRPGEKGHKVTFSFKAE